MLTLTLLLSRKNIIKKRINIYIGGRKVNIEHSIKKGLKNITSTP
tara:strand:+ start:1428 stop:1562 length:135 start_codon:yes stop_codon:yes gene_type:complete